MGERVDLEHAEREANSLKRYGDVNGFEDLADFAALALALAAECKAGRPLAAAARRISHSPEVIGHTEDAAKRLFDLDQAVRAYDQATGRPDPAAGHADDADDTEAEVGKQVFGA